MCRIFFPCRLCFGGGLVLGPRGVTEDSWNVFCVAVVGTGLTGPIHRSDRCHRSDLCIWCVLVRKVVVLVPRTSSTPVATWPWPT
jgi:hypothetical protein